MAKRLNLSRRQLETLLQPSASDEEAIEKGEDKFEKAKNYFYPQIKSNHTLLLVIAVFQLLTPIGLCFMQYRQF